MAGALLASAVLTLLVHAPAGHRADFTPPLSSRGAAH
jgi:hypothetical protein